MSGLVQSPGLGGGGVPGLYPAVDMDGVYMDNLDPSMYRLMAEHLERSLGLLHEALSDAQEGLTGIERQRVEEIKQKVAEYLEELRKAKESSGLQKFLNFFAGLGLALAMLSAVMFPSPATIAIAVLTIAFFVEPLIAEAAGGESLIGKAMTSMFEFLEDKLGMGGALAVMLGVMLAAAVGSFALATRGCTAIAGGVKSLSKAADAAEEAGEQASRAAKLARSVDKMMDQLEKFLSSKLPPEQMAVVARWMDTLQAGVVVAQGGLQMKVATVQFEIAELRFGQAMSEADLKLLDQMIETVTQSIEKMMKIFDDSVSLERVI